MKALFFGFLISLTCNSFSQKDSLLVINTIEYDVSYGISMFHKVCTNQKTYNTQNILLREFNYLKDKENSVAVENIIYYFYQNNKLVSEEYYSANAELSCFYVYEYDNLGKNILRELKVSVQNNKPVILESKEYNFEKGTTTIVAKNKTKQKTSVTTIIQDASDKVTSTLFTKNHPYYDSIISITSKSRLKDGNALEELSITTLKNNSLDSTRTKNEFNSNNQLINSASYRNGKYSGKISYEYYPSGRLKNKIVFNSTDKMTEYFSFEISKTYREFGGLKSVYLENYLGKL